MRELYDRQKNFTKTISTVEDNQIKGEEFLKMLPFP